jgi:hypothetical protein
MQHNVHPQSRSDAYIWKSRHRKVCEHGAHCTACVQMSTQVKTHGTQALGALRSCVYSCRWVVTQVGSTGGARAYLGLLKKLRLPGGALVRLLILSSQRLRQRPWPVRWSRTRRHVPIDRPFERSSKNFVDSTGRTLHTLYAESVVHQSMLVTYITQPRPSLPVAGFPASYTGTMAKPLYCWLARPWP